MEHVNLRLPHDHHKHLLFIKKIISPKSENQHEFQVLVLGMDSGPRVISVSIVTVTRDRGPLPEP